MTTCFMTTSKEADEKKYRKGQLVFINRCLWVEGREEPVEGRLNEPVIFQRDDVTIVAGQPYHHIWFVDAEGKMDFIQGMESMLDFPRTVEEVFGCKPSL